VAAVDGSLGGVVGIFADFKGKKSSIADGLYAGNALGSANV
jgi:hypothetical protein